MKIDYFLNSIVLITGSIFFLFFITFGGNFVYTAYYEEETFEKNTYIATIDVSALTHEEAVEEVETEVNNWKATTGASFRWFEQEVESDLESVEFFVEESVTNADMNQASTYELMTEIDITYIHDHLVQFPFYLQENNLVNEELLEEEILEIFADLPNNNVELSMHHFSNSDMQQGETVLYTASRQSDSPLLEAWSNDMPNLVIEAESHFSLLETFDREGIESAQGSPLSTLGSAVFEVLLHSNFDLVERHQHERLNEGIPLGFDTEVVKDEHDLVFHNPNPISYELEMEYHNGSLTVALVGETLPYTVTVDMEDVHELEPKTVVNYTEQLTLGTSSVEKSGSNGTTFDIVRTFDFPESEWQEKEWIANDYYPPEHRVELRNAAELRVTEEDDVDGMPYPELDENGNPISGSPDPSDYDSVDEFLEDYYGTETDNNESVGNESESAPGTSSGTGGTNSGADTDSGFGSDYDYDTEFGSNWDSDFGSGNGGSNSGGMNQGTESDSRWSDFWSGEGNGSSGTNGGTDQNNVTPPSGNSNSTGGNGPGTSPSDPSLPDTENGRFDIPRVDENGDPIKGY